MNIDFGKGSGSVEIINQTCNPNGIDEVYITVHDFNPPVDGHTGMATLVLNEDQAEELAQILLEYAKEIREHNTDI